MSEAEFNALRAAGKLEADPLFPIMDYHICKRVWETSPLIAALLDVLDA